MTYSKKDYKLIKFEKSTRKHKKYAAVLEHKITKRQVKVHFGDQRYQQWQDNTGLGLYSHLNHGDKKRRANYRARHKKDNLKDYTAGYFSYYFLWGDKPDKNYLNK